MTRANDEYLIVYEFLLKCLKEDYYPPIKERLERTGLKTRNLYYQKIRKLKAHNMISVDALGIITIPNMSGSLLPKECMLRRAKNTKTQRILFDKEEYRENTVIWTKLLKGRKFEDIITTEH